MSHTKRPDPKKLEGLLILKLGDGRYLERTGIITNIVNQNSKSATFMRAVILWDTDELLGIDSNGKPFIEYDDGVSNIPVSDLVAKPEKYHIFRRK